MNTVSVARQMRAAIWEVDPDLVVRGPEPLVAAATAPTRRAAIRTALFVLFALTAAFLAAIGIYGTFSWSVTQRTREIGVRMAVGAEPGRVLYAILGEAARLAFFGLIFAAALAWAGARLLRGLLYGVKPDDPLTIAGTSALVFLLCLTAAWPAARRAAHMSPADALRRE